MTSDERDADAFAGDSPDIEFAIDEAPPEIPDLDVEPSAGPSDGEEEIEPEPVSERPPRPQPPPKPRRDAARAITAPHTPTSKSVPPPKPNLARSSPFPP